MNPDLSGSGTTAQWVTAGVAFLALIAAAMFACRQTNIMKKQIDIIEWRNRRADLIARPKQLDPYNYAIEIHNYGDAYAKDVKTVINGTPQGNILDIAPKDWITNDLRFNPRITIKVSISWTDGTGPRQYENNAMYLP